jgi:hypothetical protein
MYITLLEFIYNYCESLGIDESHGLKHSMNCINWVYRLIQDDILPNDQLQMAIYAAALHDMCDKKYTNPEIASRIIHTWLLSQQWSIEMADTLISIINNMSYSLLKQRANGGEPIFPNYGKWQRAYHLARHADLLDAYLVGRCFIYTQHIEPTISDSDCWKRVEELFRIRVFNYVSDGWITLPLGIQYASYLETKAKESFLTKTFIY